MMFEAPRCALRTAAAVVDFDVIQHTGQLHAIISALGGNPDDYADDIKVVKDAINEMGGKTVSATKTKLKQLIDGVSDEAESFPNGVANEIKSQFKAVPGWAKAKSVGLGILSAGAEAIAGRRLLDGLAKIGLHIVPCGELESFAPSILASKNEWLAQVLAKHAGQFGTAAELKTANEFVRSFISD
jgi:hypothetical protein